MRDLIEELNDIKLAIFDLDGVVYRGITPIPNVNTIINELKEKSIRVVYNSNNSTITRQMYVDRLNDMGIPSEISDFYTSASITATEITKIKQNANIYVIGEIGLREELKALGHTVVKHVKNFSQINFVIVGLDMKLNYKKIVTAQGCILNVNAEFYATNPDTTFPVANGLWPGAGVMVNAVETCTGRAPVKIFGKPEPHGIKLILSDTNIPPEKACMIGDRLDTDIVAGNQAGVFTICVLTGVTTRVMLKELEDKDDLGKGNLIPNLVVNTLDEIFIKNS